MNPRREPVSLLLGPNCLGADVPLETWSFPLRRTFVPSSGRDHHAGRGLGPVLDGLFARRSRCAAGGRAPARAAPRNRVLTTDRAGVNARCPWASSRRPAKHAVVCRIPSRYWLRHPPVALI